MQYRKHPRHSKALLALSLVLSLFAVSCGGGGGGGSTGGGTGGNDAAVWDGFDWDDANWQ